MVDGGIQIIDYPNSQHGGEEFLIPIVFAGLLDGIVERTRTRAPAKLDAGIDAVMEQYGKSTRWKYRAVVYYLLVKQFRKASSFR